MTLRDALAWIAFGVLCGVVSYQFVHAIDRQAELYLGRFMQ